MATKRPRVYLSGPIGDAGRLPIWEQKENVRFATELSFSLMRRGYSILCPHYRLLSEELVHDKIPHSMWINNDLPWIEVCDALYRIPGDSKGADLEVAHAKLHGIPVYSDFMAMDAKFRAMGMLP